MNELRLLIESHNGKPNSAPFLSLNDSATTIDTLDLSDNSFHCEAEGISGLERRCHKSILKTNRRNKKVHVTFGGVTVKYYNRMVSYNPCFSGGPSIGLDWDYAKERSFTSVQSFEDQRSTSVKEQSGELSFHLSADQRYSLLMDWGFDELDIICSMHVVAKVNSRRIQTIRHLHRKAQLKQLRRSLGTFFSRVSPREKTKSG